MPPLPNDQALCLSKLRLHCTILCWDRRDSVQVCIEGKGKSEGLSPSAWPVCSVHMRLHSVTALLCLWVRVLVSCAFCSVFWSRARVHVRQKSLTKALVSLWLARLSHWLHSHNGHWLTLHWIEAITSSAVQLPNKGGQKLEKNGKSKIVPGKFQINVYCLSLRHWWWFSSPLQSKAQLYATITNSVSSGSLISQNLSELS